MDVSALKTAIATRYNAYTALTDVLTGGLHWGKASQNPTYPYARYFIVANSPEYTFTEIGENTVIQFSIFDFDANNINNDTVINSCFKQLCNCFDLCDLTVSGYTHIQMIRGVDHEIIEEDNVLHHSVDYRIMIQKSR